MTRVSFAGIGPVRQPVGLNVSASASTSAIQVRRSLTGRDSDATCLSTFELGEETETDDEHDYLSGMYQTLGPFPEPRRSRRLAFNDVEDHAQGDLSSNEKKNAKISTNQPSRRRSGKRSS